MNFLDTIPSRRNLRQIARNVAAGLKPPPEITVSEWADAVRYLSSESSAEPGKWHTGRAPYQRGIMDAINRADTMTVVIMASAQVGKTEILNNMVGFIVDRDPSPTMLVQPTLEIAEAWSKDRLTPMVRDTPALSKKINIKGRDGENTILHKKFHGGHITMAGANSPASLASRPVRVLLLDEVDRFPTSAGDEGDPVNLAIKRTTTFWNRKIIMASTPTIEGKSRIDAAYQASDRRVYETPCPHCGAFIQLEFGNLKPPRDGAPPEEWEYFCAECGAAIDESHKADMLRAGRWTARADFTGTAGFYVNEMYSPWVSWTEMITNFLEAKKLPDTLKTFINTSSAQLWTEDCEGEKIDGDALSERTETYGAQVPEGVFPLAASVDVQGDRLECEALGWGMDKETWSIIYRVIWGDPVLETVWTELDDVLSADYLHASGVAMKITIAVVDAGGRHTENVYRYVKRKAAQKKRIYAVRGHSMRGQPVIAKESRRNDYRVRVFYLGTDTTKEIIYSYLKLTEPGPGYMHHLACYDKDYFNQLTSERKVTAYEKGRTVTKWIKPSGKRNEALDLKVYNFAAYRILKPDMEKLRERFLLRVPKNTTHADDAPPDNDPKRIEIQERKASKAARRRKGGFVKNW